MLVSANWNRQPPSQGEKYGFESRHKYQALVTQLAEYSLGMGEVAGSNPAESTNYRACMLLAATQEGGQPAAKMVAPFDVGQMIALSAIQLHE